VLWYKSWLETKPRFLTSLVTLTLFCVVFVYHAQGFVRPEWKRDLNRLLFVNQQFLVIIWVLSVVLLGMGGIIREKAIGTSSLTLALPVGRMRLLISRIGVGLLEAIALGLVPWLAVVSVMSMVRKPILVSQVTSYVVLLVAGGLVFFAMGILVSSLVGGEYTAPALAFGIVLLVAIISDGWFREYSVWRLVTGDLSIERSTFLLPQHLPWLGILASLFLALVMMAASVFSVQRRDF
jgi:ABC-2 type transport system permease protein